MNVEVKEMNKKEDKKKFEGFVILMVISFIVGGIGGFGMAMLEDSGIVQSLPSMISDGLKFISMYINLVLTIICAIVVIVLYKQARKKFASWDWEDEKVYDEIEGRLSIALIITSVNQIILFVFMAIGFVRLIELIELEKQNQDWEFFIPSIVIYALGIIASLAFMLIAQQKIINFEKEMNPEKKGSVFDTKFQKKWMDSCDEAEQKYIYEAAFFSYKAINATCMILWFFCFFGMFVWDIGVLPVCLVCGIWLVSMISYFVKCIMLEKSKRAK